MQESNMVAVSGLVNVASLYSVLQDAAARETGACSRQVTIYLSRPDQHTCDQLAQWPPANVNPPLLKTKVNKHCFL